MTSRLEFSIPLDPMPGLESYEMFIVIVKSCVNLLTWLLIGCSLLCSQSGASLLVDPTLDNNYNLEISIPGVWKRVQHGCRQRERKIQLLLLQQGKFLLILLHVNFDLICSKCRGIYSGHFPPRKLLSALKNTEKFEG